MISDRDGSDLRPIGVFDSGIGGLTVLKELESAFPNENFIYLGDTARLPYGSKSSETIKRYVQQNLNFFLQTKAIKALVIACNSASSVLDQVTIPSDLPAFGVIEPGARTALSASSMKNIGLWATRATVKGAVYQKTLMQMDSSVIFTAVACPLLVPLVEEGLWDHPLADQVFDLYTPPLLEKNVDTLILGCTHYPLLKNHLQHYFEKKNIRIQIIDSALALTADVKQAIKEMHLTASSKRTQDTQICFTDDAEHFKNMVQKAFPHWSSCDFELVNI